MEFKDKDVQAKYDDLAEQERELQDQIDDLISRMRQIELNEERA